MAINKFFIKMIYVPDQHNKLHKRVGDKNDSKSMI